MVLRRNRIITSESAVLPRFCYTCSGYYSFREDDRKAERGIKGQAFVVIRRKELIKIEVSVYYPVYITWAPSTILIYLQF